jgi:RNA polymerase sigma-70 factor (ECF subfamily)
VRPVLGNQSFGRPAALASEPCLEAFLRELDYVHRTLRRLGTARSEVDDLAQDLFVALRKCWNEYDPARPLRPYLFGIAFRIAAAHHRKRTRERNREAQFQIIEVTTTDPGPEDALQSKQARALVLAALEHVPLPRRAVLVMFDLDEIPVGDIASVLGIPTFTVYSRLRKARREMGVAVRRLTKART